MRSNIAYLIYRKIRNRIKLKLRRMKNAGVLYIYPECKGGWEKRSDIVLGNKQTGSMFDPYVIPEQEHFKLFVSNRKEGSILLVKSTDGICWDTGITLLKGIENSGWEKEVNRVSVLKKEGIWFMWYTGQTKETSSIGLATSNDGIHYKRHSKNPVMVAEYSYEKKSVMNPCVLWDEEEKSFKMWYSAGEKCEPDVICYAISKDGVHWEKYGKNPIFTASDNEYDIAKVGGCDVIKMGRERYCMFYIGYQNIDNARICLAISKDGIHDWKRYKNNPIISPSKGSWDCHAVYKPAACYSEKMNQWLIWYNGRKGYKEYIGLAAKKSLSEGDLLQ